MERFRAACFGRIIFQANLEEAVIEGYLEQHPFLFEREFYSFVKHGIKNLLETGGVSLDFLRGRFPDHEKLDFLLGYLPLKHVERPQQVLFDVQHAVMEMEHSRIN